MSRAEYLEDLRQAVQDVLHKHADNADETGYLAHFIVVMQLPTADGGQSLIYSVSQGTPTWHAEGMARSFVRSLTDTGSLLFCDCDDDDGDESLA